MRQIKVALIAAAVFFIPTWGAFAQEEPKRPVIEGIIGPGFIGAEHFLISPSVVKPQWTLIPTGKIHLRFDDGKLFRPELLIEESGAFLFDRNGIREGKKPQSYGYYYFKLPLGIPVPFFTYKSSIALDADYSVLNTLLKTKRQVVINNKIRGENEYFNALSTAFTVRLYLNTPIAPNPSIFEHSYFGIYYAENTLPRTATPGTEAQNPIPLLVDTNTRSGGIFFEIKKDTPAKGLNVEIAAYLGYGHIEVRDSTSVVNAKFGNLDGLVSIKGRGVLSYRYIFPNDLGLQFSAGVEYYTDLEFFNAANTKKYNVNLGGEMRYFANLSFVFVR